MNIGIQNFKLSRKALISFSIFWMVVVSGSEFFMNQNMPLSTIIMLVLSLSLIHKKQLIKKNVGVLAVIILYIMFSTLLSFNNGIYVNDIIIDFSKLLFVFSISINIEKDDFIRKYVQIMFGLSILSLICHLYIQVSSGGPLPFQISFVGDNGLRRYATFYHTVGWELSNGIFYYTKGYGYFTRNAGIFWEPGAYQIFLNLALFLYWAKQEMFLNTLPKKQCKFMVPILVVTILSTQSTTGYVCLILNILFYLFYHDKLKKAWMKIIVVIAAGLAIALMEINLGVISNKLFSHEASYVTRVNDTVRGLDLVLEKPVLGYGFFSKNYLYDLLLQNGVKNISNGFIAFALNAGFIGLLYYLVKIYRFTRSICFNNLLCSLIAFGNFLLMFNSESVFLAPVFLLMLFPLGKGGSKNSILEKM